MKKEEILEKAKKENKNQDLYEQEVMIKGSNYGAIVVYLLATFFFILQIVLGQGMNYGLYAIVFGLSGTCFVYKYIKLRKKHELPMAITYSLLSILSSVAYIMDLVSKIK